MDRDQFRAGDTTLTCGGAEGVREIVLGIRPEATRFVEAGIEAIEPMGRETLYVVDSALGQLRVLEAGAKPRHGVGEPVALTFDAADTILFDQQSEQRIDDAHIAST